jgi:hypothetical protein
LFARSVGTRLSKPTATFSAAHWRLRCVVVWRGKVACYLQSR